MTFGAVQSIVYSVCGVWCAGVQVSEQERAALQDTIFKDIARIVAEKTVNTETNLPYTTSMIQNAMKQIQFSVHISQAHRSSKSQALEVIKKLRDVMPIARAHMILRINCATEHMAAVQREIGSITAQLMSACLPSAIFQCIYTVLLVSTAF